MGTAALLVAELAANAVRHTLSHTIHVLVEAGGEEVTISVTDCGPHQRLTVTDAGDDDEHGRGLALVDHLADQWGYQPCGAGTRVWARLNLPTSP